MKKKSIKFVPPKVGQELRTKAGIVVRVESVTPRDIGLIIIQNSTTHYGPKGVRYSVLRCGRIDPIGEDPRYDIQLSRADVSKRSRLY